MFRALRLQFLLSYLIVMATTLGLFTVAVYLFFARSLYHQLDDELLTLAKAASPSLAIARKEYPKSLNEDISWRDVFRRDQLAVRLFSRWVVRLRSKARIDRHWQVH